MRVTGWQYIPEMFTILLVIALLFGLLGVGLIMAHMVENAIRDTRRPPSEGNEKSAAYTVERKEW